MWFLTISRVLYVGDTYRKDVKYNEIVESLSYVFSLFFISSKDLLFLFLNV